jgi:hypothetical protein
MRAVICRELTGLAGLALVAREPDLQRRNAEALAARRARGKMVVTLED